MKFYVFLAKFIFAADILYDTDVAFTKIKIDENLVQIYGRDGYITLSGNDIIEHWQESKQQTQTGKGFERNAICVTVSY